jgi:chemotaxis protein MotA
MSTPTQAGADRPQRADRSSILGLALGISAVVLGTLMEGGQLGALLQPAAAVIVLGGTAGATLLSTPARVFVAAMFALRSVFTEEAFQHSALIDDLCSHAQRVRREGVLSLERVLDESLDPFLRRAVSMALEGADSKNMRHDLSRLLSRVDEEGLAVIRVWESAAGFAPTIGILGAVIGLIQVMQNLSDVALLGRGIAVAFVATIYGVALANLICIPIAEKLRLRHETRMLRMELVLEGTVAIHEGQKPVLIRDKLSALEPENDDELAPAVPLLKRLSISK